MKPSKLDVYAAEARDAYFRNQEKLWCGVEELFGSPLEKAMFWALLSTSQNGFWEPSEDFGETMGPAVEADVGFAHYSIRPQANVAEFGADYRADLVLVASYQHCLTGAVVVECDGHEFHERTKEQAARDRSRDRALQASGTSVLRFTGKEIYAEPETCAEQVWSVLNGLHDKGMDRIIMRSRLGAVQGG